MIVAAREQCLVKVYGYNGRNASSLNHLRFLNYKKAAFKALPKIAALPPSAAADTAQLQSLPSSAATDEGQ